LRVYLETVYENPNELKNIHDHLDVTKTKIEDLKDKIEEKVKESGLNAADGAKAVSNTSIN